MSISCLALNSKYLVSPSSFIPNTNSAEKSDSKSKPVTLSNISKTFEIILASSELKTFFNELIISRVLLSERVNLYLTSSFTVSASNVNHDIILIRKSSVSGFNNSPSNISVPEQNSSNKLPHKESIPDEIALKSIPNQSIYAIPLSYAASISLSRYNANALFSLPKLSFILFSELFPRFPL